MIEFSIFKVALRKSSIRIDDVFDICSFWHIASISYSETIIIQGGFVLSTINGYKYCMFMCNPNFIDKTLICNYTDIDANSPIKITPYVEGKKTPVVVIENAHVFDKLLNEEKYVRLETQEMLRRIGSREFFPRCESPSSATSGGSESSRDSSRAQSPLPRTDTQEYRIDDQNNNSPKPTK